LKIQFGRFLSKARSFCKTRNFIRQTADKGEESHISHVLLLSSNSQLHLEYFSTHLHDSLLFSIPRRKRNQLGGIHVLQFSSAVTPRLTWLTIGYFEITTIVCYARVFVLDTAQRSHFGTVHTKRRSHNSCSLRRGYSFLG